VAVVVWKQLLQDVMLVVPDPFKQTFVGVHKELNRCKATVAIEAKPNTSTDECFDALFVGRHGESPPGNLANTTVLYMCFSASLHILLQPLNANSRHFLYNHAFN